MAGNRRLLLGSLAGAVVVSLVGGYLVYALSSSNPTDETVVLSKPGVSQIPSVATNAPVAGTKLPIVALTTNDGATVSTSELLGQPLIINVWNSTCGPCKQELPAFATVQADLGDSIRFVGVNTLDTPEVNASFARDRGVKYELLRDVDGAFTSAVGITNQPVTLFVAADGTIVKQTGVLDEAALRAAAQSLLT